MGIAAEKTQLTVWSLANVDYGAGGCGTEPGLVHQGLLLAARGLRNENRGWHAVVYFAGMFSSSIMWRKKRRGEEALQERVYKNISSESDTNMDCNHLQCVRGNILSSLVTWPSDKSRSADQSMKLNFQILQSRVRHHGALVRRQGASSCGSQEKKHEEAENDKCIVISLVCVRPPMYGENEIKQQTAASPLPDRLRPPTRAGELELPPRRWRVRLKGLR